MEFHEKLVRPDAMHRGVLMLVKQGIDPREAYDRFNSFSVNIRVDSDSYNTPADEVFLLTFLELAERVFLGGVTVSGLPLEQPALTRLPGRRSLIEYVRTFTSGDADQRRCEVVLSDNNLLPAAPFSVRGVYQGWAGASIPTTDRYSSVAKLKCELGAVVAASLSVNEVFLHLSGLRRDAGRRSQGISLWELGQRSWREADPGPTIERVPNSLLLAGLGHLGQAYAWTLAALGYREPGNCQLWLQDYDKVGISTPSTSILTNGKDVGRHKSRVVSAWLEERGFETRIVERPFTGEHRRLAEEPTAVMCGFDNAPSRRMLLGAGHSIVFEAGLGSGADDFRLVRAHTLPQLKAPAELWPDDDNHPSPEMPQSAGLDAYGLDECGMALLGSKAVGVPFVGMFASSLLIADMLRRLHGGQAYATQDVDVADIQRGLFVPDINLKVPFPSFANQI